MTKTKFGTPSAIASKTPDWAKWMFRIVFGLTTGATAYIASTNLLTTEAKYEITLLLKLVIDPAVFTLSKMFGVKEVEK